MTLRSCVLATGLVAMGFGLGRLSVRSVQSQPPVAVVTRETKVVSPTKRAVEKTMAIAAVVVDATTPATVVTSGLLQQIEGLRQSGLLTYSVHAFDAHKHLTREARLLLQITPEEEAAFNRLMDETKAEIWKAEGQKAVTVKDASKPSITIQIPAFPDEGGRIYDQTVLQIKTILGEGRSQLVQQMGGMDQWYAQFGVGVREIVIERNPSQPQVLQIFDQSKTMPDEQSKNGVNYRASSSSTSYESRETFIQQMGPVLGGLIPPDL